MSKVNPYYQGCAGKINPQKIAEFNFNPEHHIIEEKYDGIWASVEYDKDGVVTLISRPGKKKDNEQLQSLIRYLQNFGLKNTVLVGELAFGSQAAKEFSNKHGHHKIDLFDILKLKGEELYEYSLVVRKHQLSVLLHTHEADPLWVKNGEWVKAESAKFVQIKYDEVVAQGGEGLIVKDTRDRNYIFGGKSKLWYKIKKLVTMDYVIMGYSPTDSADFAARGWIGGIICGLYQEGELVEKVTLGSMTFQLREMFSKDKHKYIGQVLEVGGNEIFKSGALRHPFYKGLRDDKDPLECVW